MRNVSALLNLIGDVDGTIERSSEGHRARTLSRITDLLVRDCDELGEDQVEVFDRVILRFAGAVEIEARAELAERLAPLANGPRGVLRRLALDDDIVVARPVLVRSRRLDDQDLITAATEKGLEHRLAICERKHVAEPVTDALIEQSDVVVRRKLAGNPGARLSPLGTASLITACSADEVLQDLLGARHDLSPGETEQLVAAAKDSARRRLLGAYPEECDAESLGVSASEHPARAIPAGPSTDYSRALATIDALSGDRAFGEADLAAVASDGLVQETVCGFSRIVGLSLPGTERVFSDRDDDLLLVICKAQGWAWRTVKALLRIRDPGLRERHHFHRVQATLDGIGAATAKRVVHALLTRDGKRSLTGARS